LVVFLSLRPQVIVIAGRNGVLPVGESLAAQQRDFPGWRRFFYFPTLLWLDSSDRSLRVLVWLGIAGAASIAVGGPHAPWAFAACYVAYLSLDRAMTLIYPWDAMVFEAAFWGAFLPATELLPDLACQEAPSAPVAWAFRLLAFRVLFGFGKHKFLGSTLQDSGFLRGFLAMQPLPNPIAWWLQKLPMPLLKFGLVVLFVTEIVLPFGVFAPGPFASFAAVSALALMGGIFPTGNYGHFNLILSVVVLSWFDHETARQLSLASLATPAGAVFVVHTLIALIGLPFDTFLSFSWPMFSAWRRAPRWISATIAVARWLTPFRLVHPYGVFPPYSLPAARIAPVVEVTWDDREWHELSHRYYPTREDSALRFCAPHHERFDQAIGYEGSGVNEMSVYRAVMGRWDPYGYGGVSAPQRFLHRLLAGTMPGKRFYDRNLEKQRGAPRQARVRAYMLEPASVSERAATGRWWIRTLVGPHIPPQRLADLCVDQPQPPPELWHLEDVYWLERSNLGRAMKRCARGEDPHELVAVDAPELTVPLIEQFWREFVPWVNQLDRSTFQGVRRNVEALRERYDRQTLYAFERLTGRYGALLFARLEPLFNRDRFWETLRLAPPALGTPSVYELRLLTHHIIAGGRAVYNEVLANPEAARTHAESMTMFTGHSFLVLFRYEAMLYQSQKIRLGDAMTKIGGRPAPNERQRAAQEKMMAVANRLTGVLTVAAFLKTQFTEPEHILDVPERYPSFVFSANGEVVRADRDALDDQAVAQIEQRNGAAAKDVERSYNHFVLRPKPFPERSRTAEMDTKGTRE
jgi:hypothetical protein